MSNKCPVCGSKNVDYEFIVFSKKLFCCVDCSHIFKEKDTTESAKQSGNLEIVSTEEIVNVIDRIDFVNDPYNFLLRLRDVLKKNQELVLQLASTDSKNAKKYKSKWQFFDEDRKQFFSNETIQNLLCRTGFSNIVLKSLDNDKISISCKKNIIRKTPVLSIIIPVYNEMGTINILLNMIYNKIIDGVEKELIIIESNSTDGTREAVLEFVKEHPEIKLILEDSPQGKGHAVRAGFQAASGDFIAIQDGDLEYDVNDYDELIRPLINYQKAFVLGSRHSGNWKMRDFGKNEKGLTAYTNLGQMFFTALINFGCKVKLNDPFTMYKLFRKECLFQLDFDGNRFEIDWEIVIKLMRKGYVPLEIPINYNSRPFSKGKKIALVMDPLRWFFAFFRYNYGYKIK